MEVLALIVLLSLAVVVFISKMTTAGSASDEDDMEHSLHIVERESTSESPVLKSDPAAVDYLKWLPCRFVVLDLETTGLDPEKNEIIEYGAIKVQVGTTDQLAFQMLVKPEKNVSKKITQITGITQEMLEQEGVEPQEALTQLMQFIEDLPLVTYNADFDMGFLHSTARKYGAVVRNPYTCALKRARRAWPGLASYKLVDLARMGNLSIENAHRAVGDCERALIVFLSSTSVLDRKVRWTHPIKSGE